MKGWIIGRDLVSKAKKETEKILGFRGWLWRLLIESWLLPRGMASLDFR